VEPFTSILKSVVKQGFSIEVTQCLTAILGILARLKDLWSLLLPVNPIMDQADEKSIQADPNQ
jgi:hypothetical protein